MFFFVLAPCRLMHRGTWFDPREIFYGPGMLSFRYSVKIAQRSFVDLKHHINNGYEDFEPCFLLSFFFFFFF